MPVFDAARMSCAAARLRELVALGGGGEDRAVAGQREADRLAEAVHRVGGEHAASSSRRSDRRCRSSSSEPLVGDLPGGALADALEDGDQVERLARAASRPASIGPPETKIVGTLARAAPMSMPGTILSQFGMQISASKQWARDHRLDRVGDDLARGQRVVHPLVAHDDAVVDADRVELERDAAGGADRLLDDLAERLEVDVARDDVDVRVADGDERAVPLAVLHLTRRAEQAAVRRALDAALDRVRTHVVVWKG